LDSDLKFDPDVSRIKKIIEEGIDKSYYIRDPKDKKMLIYKA